MMGEGTVGAVKRRVGRPVGGRGSSRAGVVWALVLVGLVGGSCGGRDSRAVSEAGYRDGAAVSTSSPVDGQSAERSSILAAYRQATETFMALGADPSSRADDPRLGEYAVDEQLVIMTATLAALKASGHRFEGRMELHPQVTSIEAGEATIRDCNLDRSAEVVTTTGDVVIPAGERATWVTALMRRGLDGSWRLAKFSDTAVACSPA